MPEERQSASDETSGSTFPGLTALREALARRIPTRFGSRKNRRADAVAGLSVTLANVPDGLANAVLVGVNPIAGLYATMIGPFTGALVSSAQLMIITTTAAASLTAGQSLAALQGGAREDALFMMVVLVGLLQLIAGALGLGRLTRFVSYSVTTGFLTGVAVLLIMSQLPALTGIAASGSNKLLQTYDLLTQIGDLHVPTLLLGVTTLVLAVLLPRTRLGSIGRLVAVVVASLGAAFLFDGVRVVSDVGDIPRTTPTPDIPDIRVAFDVLTGAISVALVILVQGVGVSQSVSNPDGSRPSASRDFIAQGVANVASGLFRGLPVGGSVSTTALSVVAGAQSRWAAIFAGLWMAVVLIVVPGPVEYVAMPALAALLVLAGVGSIKPREIATVWSAGWEARLAGGATFLAMLTLPIQAAVGIGVILSALLHMRDAITELRIVELVIREDGRFEERTPPTELPSNEVTLLGVYGDLAYAGARTLEARLPTPRKSERPVVVLRLRGRGATSATLLDVISHYAEDLGRAGGRLYLAGLGPGAYRRLVGLGTIQSAGHIRIYEATPILGESAQAAVADARAWLAGELDSPGDE